MLATGLTACDAADMECREIACRSVYNKYRGGQLGRGPSSNKRRYWALAVDDNTRDLAEALAKAEDRSVSAYVRQLIRREHAATGRRLDGGRMKRDDGGPAFPAHYNPPVGHLGMTLRDWFATGRRWWGY